MGERAVGQEDTSAGKPRLCERDEDWVDLGMEVARGGCPQSQ